MRINHNLTAINTHRQMGISELDGSKSMEKLSSGFRINRAGDDAAGLAISEKMRGQVRGLSMASKNSSDTISLIQTAEGALAETHSILQRMRELSVQSANDTNTDKDREELQAEVTQLKAEIDRIGNTTEFNTKKLLEGSATGVRDEIVGTLRINNNSSLVIDANMEKAMAASIGDDKSWAFDGAYMLVKVNQTFDASQNKIFKAEDYNLVGPDGKVFKFKTYTPDTKVLANQLEAGTIVAEGGDTLNINKKGALTSTIGAGNTIITGATLTDKELTKIGSGSELVAGSSFVLKDGAELAIKAPDGEGSLGLASIKSNNGVLELYNSDATPKLIGKVEAGKSVILDNGAVLKNIGGGEVRIESGSIELVDALVDADTTTPTNVNVTSFTVAAQSTLTDTSVTLYDDTNLTLSSNLLVRSGAIDKNVTVGNSVNLTSNGNSGKYDGDISELASGSILAKGSTIEMKEIVDGVSSIKIEVNGKAVDISYDMTSGVGILKVGGEMVAAGKSITLEDGTVLTHNSTLEDPNTTNGVVFVEHGRIKLDESINAVTSSVAGSNGKAWADMSDDDKAKVAGANLGELTSVTLASLANTTFAASTGITNQSSFEAAVAADSAAVWALIDDTDKTAILSTYDSDLETLNDDGILDTNNVKAFTAAKDSTLVAGTQLAGTVEYSTSGGESITKSTNIDNAAATTADIELGAAFTATSTNIAKVGDSTLTAGSVITLTAGQSITIGTDTYTYRTGTNDWWDGTAVVPPGAVGGLTFAISGTTATITVSSGTADITGDTIGAAAGDITSIQFAKGSTLGGGTQATTTGVYVTEALPPDSFASVDSYGVRLMAGSVVNYADNTYSGSVTMGAGGTNIQFSANTGDALAARYYDLKVSDSFTYIFTEYDAASSNLNDSIMSQIGANSGQTTFLSINDMRCKALGVDMVDISTKWGAATAIETVNNALQKVSHQRSSLGALQNRLEHTIKNLDTAAENLQAAESRIRDVDMAKEVMEFTRTNILQQAAQAMLAQANQQPQSVLQLLR